MTAGKKGVDADAGVPEWAKGIVWYQILPERFCNGDPGNDPLAPDQQGAWPHDHTSPLITHPWTSDWYRQQPYEKENAWNIWLNLQRRRYGGDLQGIINKLGYLQDLGVGAIYLNPVFASPSHHKYDGSTYHHIDPNFGPDPAGDRHKIASEVPHEPSTWVWTEADRLFLDLVARVHERGMYIIIDGVFNHMGLQSWVYRDVEENQRESPYRDWLDVVSWADEPEGFKFGTWEGYNELPAWSQTEDGLTGGPRQYIFDITSRWMDPPGFGKKHGVDGWRLDVAHCVKHPFWKSWRTHVRGINPQAYMVGEVFEDIEEQKLFLQGDEFDAVMNYNFTFACVDFFIRHEEDHITSAAFHARLQELHDAFSPDVSLVMQNLLGSHDTDRIASRIANRARVKIREWSVYYETSKGSNPEYYTGCPSDRDFDLLKLMTLFQFTWPGAPMIYYGDEAGMWGANDPCCRKPMMWEEMEFEDEHISPAGTPYHDTSGVAFRRDLFEWIRKLAALRNEYQVLKTGDIRVLTTDREDHVCAFTRTLGDKSILVVINAGDEPAMFSHDAEMAGNLEKLAVLGDVIIGKSAQITMPPRSALLTTLQRHPATSS